MNFVVVFFFLKPKLREREKFIAYAIKNKNVITIAVCKTLKSIMLIIIILLLFFSKLKIKFSNAFHKPISKTIYVNNSNIIAI